MDRLFREEPGIFSLGVDDVSKAHLLETARWTKFLAILGIIFTAIMLLAMVAMAVGFSMGGGDSFAAAGLGIGMVFLYALLVGLYFYPIWALFKFSKLVKIGILTGNQQVFNEALGYQKGMYKYIGILSIIIMSFYGIAIIFLVLGRVFMGGV